LDDEDILASHILLDLNKDLHVRKAPDEALRQRRFEIGGDGISQGPIAIAGDQLHGALHPMALTGVN
jgi:hypothetical protein